MGTFEVNITDVPSPIVIVSSSRKMPTIKNLKTLGPKRTLSLRAVTPDDFGFVSQSQSSEEEEKKSEN
jgi:hypothetical protein